MNLKNNLIPSLDEARSQLEMLIPKVDKAKEIYPRWTIKQLLAHIAGWDDAVIVSLRAHLDGKASATPADRGVDFYNAQSVEARENLDYEQTYREWQASRLTLKSVILTAPEDKFVGLICTPWSEKATLSQIIAIFSEHEREHAADIRRWLENPDRPLANTKP